MNDHPLTTSLDQFHILSHKLAVMHRILDCVQRGTHELTSSGLRAIVRGLNASIKEAGRLETIEARAASAALPGSSRLPSGEPPCGPARWPRPRLATAEARSPSLHVVSSGPEDAA